MFPFHSHQMKTIGPLKYAPIVLIVLGKQISNIYDSIKPVSALFQCYLYIYHSTGLFIPLPLRSDSGPVLSSPLQVDKVSTGRVHYTETMHELWFYSSTLIFTVLISTGVCLFIVIIWVVNKVAYTHYNCRFYQVVFFHVQYNNYNYCTIASDLKCESKWEEKESEHS